MSRTAVLITLSDEEKRTLLSWTRSGKTQQRYVLRARIVLSASQGVANRDIARNLGTRKATVCKWRRRFHESGLSGLQDKPHSGKPAKYGESSEKRILPALDSK